MSHVGEIGDEYLGKEIISFPLKIIGLQDDGEEGGEGEALTLT